MNERDEMKPLNGFFVLVYYVVGLVARILHPTTVEGLEDLPKRGVLLCPNHSSNWDPILVVLRMPINARVHIMGKAELFRNPILGWILRKVGAFPVDRGSNDINTVRTAMQAIKAMPGPTLLIAGGYDKHSEFDEWIESFDGKVRYLVLIGQTRDKIAECAKRHGFTDIMYAEDLLEAVQVCASYANPGDNVLLSPACASWGQFKNFEERGRKFKEYVRGL